MKALVYHGTRNVSVDNVSDARIERPTDVLVRITSTNICGSDLHMYEGRTDMPPNAVLGHENLGEVVEVGEAVDRVEVGDRVAIPFNIGCGFCANCERGLSAFCLTTADLPSCPTWPERHMGLPIWGRIEAARLNCFVFRTATTIAWFFRRMLRRKSAIM
jgi:glutathione-independent formaldehyde dehydrogenase